MTRRSLIALVLCLAIVATGCAAGRTPGGVPETTGAATPGAGTPATAPPESVLASQPTSFSPSAAWPRVGLQTAWSGLAQPVYLTSRDGDPEGVFIAEKGGIVREARGDAIRSFLDLSDGVSTGGEQGLLSIAFPPGAAASQRFYVYYTDKTGDVVIARYAIADGVGAAGSKQEVLRIPHRAHRNHNGGQLQFGTDGMLYIGIGDGGGSGDPNGNGQNLGVLYAKILRIDVEGVTAGGKVPARYLVPPDNPYVKRPGARPETWDWGLRNPWRFTFDAVTDDLYIGDVGQDAWEEIDFQPAGVKGGVNYGWSVMEGMHAFKGGSTKGLTPPVAEYGHDLGNAVVGGYVYRGDRSSGLRGYYFFADNGSGRLWGMRREDGAWKVRELLHTRYSIASFGQDAQRELYVLDIAGGAVYHLVTQ